ncbi:MAG: hypothetical protein Unbinned5374contig1001_29 [Prokaryotic dsDNA virus sp.]|nr:MAG: hypothetical protein Unbinned5374contig1001_29 [Prokaryotic dsDNA virus sp.]
MILYKGKAKDYSLNGIKKSLAKKSGVIVHKNILLHELIEKVNQCIIQKKKS